MFGLRKEKKEDVIKENFDIPASFDDAKKDYKPLVEAKEELQTINEQFLSIPQEETKEVFKTMPEEIPIPPQVEKKETFEAKEENPESKQGTDRIELEELSMKVENEVGKIDRKIKTLEKKANEISIESQELIDLIRLYAATGSKFQEFIDEMRKLEERGWNTDENIAAFYKFRIGKALSEIKRQSMKVEGMCEKVGFTPSKIKEILNSPIEELVDSLAKGSRARR